MRSIAREGKPSAARRRGRRVFSRRRRGADGCPSLTATALRFAGHDKAALRESRPPPLAEGVVRNTGCHSRPNDAEHREGKGNHQPRVGAAKNRSRRRRGADGCPSLTATALRFAGMTKQLYANRAAAARGRCCSEHQLSFPAERCGASRGEGKPSAACRRGKRVFSRRRRGADGCPSLTATALRFAGHDKAALRESRRRRSRKVLFGTPAVIPGRVMRSIARGRETITRRVNAAQESNSRSRRGGWVPFPRASPSPGMTKLLYECESRALSRAASRTASMISG